MNTFFRLFVSLFRKSETRVPSWRVFWSFSLHAFGSYRSYLVISPNPRADPRALGAGRACKASLSPMSMSTLLAEVAVLHLTHLTTSSEVGPRRLRQWWIPSRRLFRYPEERERLFTPQRVAVMVRGGWWSPLPWRLFFFSLPPSRCAPPPVRLVRVRRRHCNLSRRFAAR